MAYSILGQKRLHRARDERLHGGIVVEVPEAATKKGCRAHLPHEPVLALRPGRVPRETSFGASRSCRDALWVRTCRPCRTSAIDAKSERLKAERLVTEVEHDGSRLEDPHWLRRI